MEFGNVMQYLKTHPEAPRILLLSEIASGTFATGCIYAAVLIVHQLPNICIHAESSTEIYEGWVLAISYAVFEYLMNDNSQMSCFPEMVTHVSQISAVPVSKRCG